MSDHQAHVRFSPGTGFDSSHDTDDMMAIGRRHDSFSFSADMNNANYDPTTNSFINNSNSNSNSSSNNHNNNNNNNAYSTNNYVPATTFDRSHDPYSGLCLPHNDMND
ncbi:unnamed protein product [Absidia cylindrospora]